MLSSSTGGFMPGGGGPHRIHNLVGQRFARLVVLEFHSISPNNGARWLAKCDCGNTTVAYASGMKQGSTKSCGCYNRDRMTKHGMEGSKVYAVWSSMLSRCRNHNHPSWRNYGGRGISVCERWEKFENFLADMGQPTGVLDRINNDGHYSPDNCRWATWSQSNKNKRQPNLNNKE
jgi:hypothetical protein